MRGYRYMTNLKDPTRLLVKTIKNTANNYWSKKICNVYQLACKSDLDQKISTIIQEKLAIS
jgi:hypothetical protein